MTEYMEKGDCERIHEQIGETHRQFLEESREDRKQIHGNIEAITNVTNGKLTEVHTKIGNLQLWAIGLIVTVLVGCLGLIVQGERRTGKIAEMSSNMKQLTTSIDNLNDKSAVQSFKIDGLSTELEEHKRQTLVPGPRGFKGEKGDTGEKGKGFWGKP